MKIFGRFLLTLFFIVSALFFLLRELPGGPFDKDLALPPEVKSRLEERYHFHEPLYVQYFTYLNQLVHGDLGESYVYMDRKVMDILKETLPITVSLGAAAFVLSYTVGIFLGLLSVKKSKWAPTEAISLLANTGSSMPPFLTGPLLVYFFSFQLDWFPPALWEGPRYYILPVLALSFRPLCLVTKVLRASALENINSDYVQTALAKGVGEWSLLFKHVLKNSLIPILSISGSLFAQILSGSFLVEQIFAVPGVARYFVESVTNRDYSLLIGLAVFYSILLVSANMFMEKVATIIDPRLTREGES